MSRERLKEILMGTPEQRVKADNFIDRFRQMIHKFNKNQLRILNGIVVDQMNRLQEEEIRLKKQLIRPGTDVYFYGKHGECIEGKVKKIKRKNAEVLVRGTIWNVTISLLEPQLVIRG